MVRYLDTQLKRSERVIKMKSVRTRVWSPSIRRLSKKIDIASREVRDLYRNEVVVPIWEVLIGSIKDIIWDTVVFKVHESNFSIPAAKK